MGFGIRALTRPVRAVCLSVATAAALSACVSAETSAPVDAPDATSGATSGENAAISRLTLSATTTDFPNDGFQYQNAATTVRAGLKGISHRYIDRVEVQELALDGIRGLATIDPLLALDQQDGIIRLRLNDLPIASLPRPVGNDPAAWADLTTDVVRIARDRSEDVHDADNERIYEALFDGMLAGLDIFSRYSGAEEARANRARRDGFGGIGIRFSKADGAVLITHVQDDGPAHAVGLKPGDMILTVNGEDITKLSLRKVAKHLRGPVGSQLTLSITRLDSDIKHPDRHISFSLYRAHVVPDTVRASVEDDILNVRVSGFNKKTSPSMHDILRNHDAGFKSGRLKGVVMDLRDNPGGLLSQSVNVADLFLDQGRIIATRGRHPDSFHDYRAGGVDLIEGKPLVILVDGDSASAAEIVASALQDLGRAVVVGSASYGKGTVQTVIRLPNDGEMTLTWSRLVSPHGYALHGLGVMPAVCATNTKDTSTDAILSADHIDGQREALAAWRAAGLIFDGRRPRLRHACPAKAFKPAKNGNKSGDLLMQLAGRVINDPALYRRAILLSEPVSTASRQ